MANKKKDRGEKNERNREEPSEREKSRVLAILNQ